MSSQDTTHEVQIRHSFDFGYTNSAFSEHNLSTIVIVDIRRIDYEKEIVIDGGPRKNMNTAKLLQRFAEGAKYDNYELGGFSEEAKYSWRDAHWEKDLQKAYEAGKKMAEQ